MVVTIFKTASAVFDSTLCCFKKLSTVLPTFSPLQCKANPCKHQLSFVAIKNRVVFQDKHPDTQTDTMSISYIRNDVKDTVSSVTQAYF